MKPERIEELAREQAKRYEYWRGSTAPLSLDGVIANAIRTAVREALEAAQKACYSVAEAAAIGNESAEWVKAVGIGAYAAANRIEELSDELT